MRSRSDAVTTGADSGPLAPVIGGEGRGEGANASQRIEFKTERNRTSCGALGPLTLTLSPDDGGEGTKRRGRVVAFLAACAAALATWGVLLPWLTRQPAIQSMIDRNESLGINAGAKFYTESESSRHAMTRLESIQRREPQALWATE